MQKEGNINTCIRMTVFLLPGELQLVDTGARQHHAAPQQAGSDLCMQQPGERRRSMTRHVPTLGTCAGGRIISLVN